jgi:mono/diheme cytochrome c family protein
MNRAFARICRVPGCVLAVVVLTVSVAAAPQTATVDFAREVQPVFARRCFPCHGPTAAKAGLRLNARERAVAKLESGRRAIVPGKPSESAILERIASDDPTFRMPPEGKPLAPEEIDRVHRWIEQGAPWKTHWAFEPIRQQPPPATRDRAWVRNPVDAFVLAKLEQRGLAPSPPAEPDRLLRRVYFDLTGLPPSPTEVEAFLKEAAVDLDRAYEAVVDRLLQSDRYGERWARHWLDVVRFAETNSFERDGVKPHAWRYRDYVIRSFNADKPYDQFIREQLAGDELPDATADSLIATGFYRLGLWDDEPADRELAMYDGFDDIVTTVGQTFLGLTVNCARCHDHKIDPIPQRDYYSLVAFFRNITPNGYENPNVVRPIFAEPGDRDRYDVAVADLKAKQDEAQRVIRTTEDDFRRLAGIENDRGRDLAQLLKSRGAEVLGAERFGEYQGLQKRLDELKKAKVWDQFALCVTEHGRTAPDTFVLGRGNPQSKGDVVPPAFPSVLGGGEPGTAAPDAAARTTGRRLALANWIAAPDNHLTGRVIVNRICQHHFGRGIVRSPNNFGQLGDAPTHPELLDWLAGEFVRLGWRMKPMHKLIVMSATYRQAAESPIAGSPSATPHSAIRTPHSIDPANDLFWRQNMRRLSAEEVRDSILAVNGRLNLAMYGPGFYPEISAEVLAGQSQPGSGWGKSSYEEQARRSVYIHVKRSLLVPMLATFDFPDTDTSCEARFNTTQPGQALSMINGDFVNREAGELAARVRREAGDRAPAQVALALRLALCRDPSPAEIDRGVRLVANLQQRHGHSADAALANYCLVVLNLNEFMYVD